MNNHCAALDPLVRERIAVEQSPASIVITDVEGRIQYVNAKFTQISGYSFAEVQGKNPRLLKSGEMSAEAYRQLWQTISAGRPWRGEFHNRRKNGELYWESVSISPVLDQAGAITHYVAVKEDITARKDAEDRLREVNRELEMAKAKAELAIVAKSEFLAKMSREIRVPMNCVLGMLQLLLETSLTQEQRHFAETAHVNGQATLTLLNSVLDSKIEARKLELQKVSFELRRLLGELAGMHTLRAQARGLELECVVAPEVPSKFEGDPERLRQALSTIVDAALEYALYGRVSIRVETLGESAGQSRLRFAVRGPGIRIPADKAGQLRGHLAQLDSPAARAGDGPDLTLCKQLVVMMGGELGLDSPPGEAAMFWFTVRLNKPPGAAPPAPPKETPAAPARLDFTRYRVLVADDNYTNQLVFSGLLKRIGVQVTTVSNGREAVQAAEGQAFDLVLMDLQMPELDGFGAAEVIRNPASACRNHLVPIVAVTAHGSVGYREQCVQCGMNDFLTKPFTAESLQSVLEKWLKTNGESAPPSPETSQPQAEPPKPAVEAAGVVFDHSMFLQRMMGDERLATNVARGFLMDMPQQMAQLRKLAAARDAEGTSQQAHRIKGAAGNVNGERLRALAAMFEVAAKAGDLDAILPRLNECDQEYAQLVGAIETKFGAAVKKRPA